jgi:hypothetical protein
VFYLKNEINSKLEDIESQHGVKILHAVESGSRAWGFASKDSDYDVRFIYVRPLEYYLQLRKYDDVLNCELNDVFDINGWDVQKVLKLAYKSNPTIFEWSQSPIVYKTTPIFESLQPTIFEYFSCKSGLYHYLSTAKGNYREYLKGETVRLKKYLYVVRPLLACRWILERQTPPPMLFSELVKAELPNYMKPHIDKLLELKLHSNECDTYPKIEPINQWIESETLAIEQEILKLPNSENQGWQPLEDMFLKILGVKP